MADFRINEANITARLGAGTTGISGFTYNNAAYNVFSAPISNSRAVLPYGYASPTGFTVNEVDICNSLGPKETKYTANGTHTLSAGCTQFMIMAIGGGGGGGSGGISAVGSTGGGANSGGGGNCVYAAYPIVAGQTAITITIGTAGPGGGARRGIGTGSKGTAGGSTIIVYNGSTYVTATGGTGGTAGPQSSTAGAAANIATAAPTYNTTELLANSLITAIGTYNAKSLAVGGAAKTSAWNIQFALANKYTNTSSVGRGSGGAGGGGISGNDNTTGTAGGVGTAGYVSIFEYF